MVRKKGDKKKMTIFPENRQNRQTFPTPLFSTKRYFLARLRPFKKRILRREKGIQKV
jgi:hypothetical protein